MRSSIVSASGVKWALRRIETGDGDRLLAWRNASGVRAAMIHNDEISSVEHEAWFARALAADDGLVTILEIDGRPSGMIALSRIERRDSNARWGFYLAPADVPPGSGSRMGYLMLVHAFSELGLHRVYADVIASNAPSIGMHRKLGFREEGRWREHLRRGTVWEDLVLFGLLATEFASARPALAAELFS